MKKGFFCLSSTVVARLTVRAVMTFKGILLPSEEKKPIKFHSRVSNKQIINEKSQICDVFTVKKNTRPRNQVGFVTEQIIKQS